MLHAHSQSVSCITSSSTSTESHSAEELARRIGADRGATVRGGFIFGPDGARLGRGWRGYAAALEAEGAIIRDGGGYRLAAEAEAAPPARSVIEAPRTVAAREARRPVAIAKAERQAEAQRRRQKLRAAAAAFLEERRPGYFTEEQIAEGIGSEDIDGLCEVLADGSGEHWDVRSVGSERIEGFKGAWTRWEYTALLHGARPATPRDELLRGPGVTLLATRRAREYGKTWRVDLLRCVAPDKITCFVKVASDWKTGKFGESFEYLTEGEARGLFEFYPTGHSTTGWAIPEALEK